MDLSFLGDAIGAIMSGGITGILGSAISMFAKYKLQRLQFDHEINKMEQETIQLEKEYEGRLAITMRESEAKENVSADSLMEGSYTHDRATYATGKEASNSKWFIALDFWRGSIRPAVTSYLIVLVSILTYKIYGLLEAADKAISAEVAMGLLQQMIMVLLYITATVVLWWFGTRSKVLAPK